MNGPALPAVGGRRGGGNSLEDKKNRARLRQAGVATASPSYFVRGIRRLPETIIIPRRRERGRATTEGRVAALGHREKL